MPPKIKSLKLDRKNSIAQFELILYKLTVQKIAISHNYAVVILLLQMRNRGKGGAHYCRGHAAAIAAAAATAAAPTPAQHTVGQPS